MPTTFTLIAPDLFRAPDTCNSYLIVRGDRAIAIDPGSGAWLDHLHEIGVKHLDWVLLTHTHRDQCAGVYRLNRRATKLAVPAIERHLVEDAEGFWRSRQVYHNYNQVDDFLSLPRGVPVDHSMEDYDTFEWLDVPLEVVPAPGHSPGHIALVGEFNGKRIAFTGDMIEAPHHTPSVHCTQYAYCDTVGATLLIHSFRHLLEHEPDLLLPGRGPVIDQPRQACEKLIASLRGFCHEMYGPPDTTDQQGFRQLSPRLLTTQSSCCSYYVVLDGKGHAVLIDAGYPEAIFGGGFHDHGYRTRFLPTALNNLRKHHGVTKIDAVLVTHYHDDHIIGIPYLQKKFGTPVWCLDRIAPILERPTDFNMPCLMPLPIRVDRTVPDRGVIEWGGVRFSFHDMPGQTDLHSGICFNLDGKRWLAMGDSAHWREGKLGHGHIIFANRVAGPNHLKVADRMLELKPDVLLHGHPRPQPDGDRADTPVTHQDLLDFQASAQRAADSFVAISGEEADLRCRMDWVRIEPYRMSVKAGDVVDAEIVAENVTRKTMRLALRLILPEGMTAEPAAATCDLAPGAVHRSRHAIRVERLTSASPTIACVNVQRDGKPLGWLGHGQLWHGGTPR